MTGEFDLIRRHFQRPQPHPDVVLGSGDDAALLRPRVDRYLAVTTDAQVLGTHFDVLTPAADVGWKSLAVNLSDLAAMGAETAAFTCALTLPSLDERWIADFAAGLYECAESYCIALVGGNISRGPLSVTIQAMGWCEPQRVLRRDGAQVGDRICVTGTLGDAALALRLQQHTRAVDAALLGRLRRPLPRLSAGRALAGIAHAGIDLSDGFAADLAHMLAASGVGARVQAAQLPRSAEFVRHCPAEQVHELLLAGGEEYELCVSLPPERFAEVQSLLDVPLTEVGEITAARGLRVVGAGGRPLNFIAKGFQHFPPGDQPHD